MHRLAHALACPQSPTKVDAPPLEELMAIDFEQRFDELCQQAEAILAAKTQNRTRGFEGTYVDAMRLAWPSDMPPNTGPGRSKSQPVKRRGVI